MILPGNNNNHVGIEIELLSPFDSYGIERKINDLGLQKIVEVGADGSIETDVDCECCQGEGYYYDDDGYENDCSECSELQGHELKVITTQKNLKATMIRVGQLLKAIKAQVNASCGLHVHLDMRNRTPQLAAARLLNSQSLLLKSVPHDRRENTYCMPVNKIYKSPDMIMNIPKYHAIHTEECYKYLKTIEVRLHEGTVDWKEIYNWCKLLISIVDNDYANKNVRSTKILPTRVRKYIEKRIAAV